MSKQVLKSGTSIGANVKESVNAQSNADFISKMSIALKEADETEYWLELLNETDYISDEQFNSIIYDCRELRQYRIKIALKMRSQIFRQVARKIRRQAVACQGFFV